MVQIRTCPCDAKLAGSSFAPPFPFLLLISLFFSAPTEAFMTGSGDLRTTGELAATFRFGEVIKEPVPQPKRGRIFADTETML